VHPCFARLSQDMMGPIPGQGLTTVNSTQAEATRSSPPQRAHWSDCQAQRCRIIIAGHALLGARCCKAAASSAAPILVLSSSVPLTCNAKQVKVSRNASQTCSMLWFIRLSCPVKHALRAQTTLRIGKSQSRSRQLHPPGAR